MSSKKKKRKKGKKKKKGADEGRIKKETKYSVIAVGLYVLAFFLILAAWNKSGIVGDLAFRAFDTLLGVGFFLLPLSLFILGTSFLRIKKPEVISLKIGGAALLFFTSLGLISLIFKNGLGGVVGKWVAMPFVKLFDIYASIAFLLALLVISILLVFDINLSFKMPSFSLFRKKDEEEEDDYDIEGEYEEDDDGDEEEEDEEDDEEEDVEEDEEEDVPVVDGYAEEEKVISTSKLVSPLKYGTYTPPPVSLLERDKGKPGVGDIKANANIIKRTLQNFGITVEMDEVTVGPSVTRYALKPAEGIKLSRIVGLQNDLGLALAAHPIRIEAPIPGKSLVGIEVPNTARSTVGLAGLLSSPEYKESDKPLLFTLGKNISGKSFYANLARLPHVLIAGSTGSGKSVTIHAIINSLLYRNSPEDLRLIMVDPKRVELTLYNKIPHLLTPVITDPKKTILALKWAAKEMDRRYDILESESVRDIGSYHKNIVEPAYTAAKKRSSGGELEESGLPETMPYIVVIIDELADIMATYPRELESAIVRLAQMSRAVGIHLVVSTQRPSVNVITGLIKANIPARIALQVSSQIDSRTILDTGGAEKLLGAGDMLYLSGEMSQPQRIQSAFISETEVKKVVKFLAKQSGGETQDAINLSADSAEKNSLFEAINNDADHDDDEDDLYEEARETVMRAGKASTSYLQRKLKVGYARAARLMDMLEERGVVGPAEGSKPREVLSGNEDGYGDEHEDYDEDDEKR